MAARRGRAGFGFVLAALLASPFAAAATEAPFADFRIAAPAEARLLAALSAERAARADADRQAARRGGDLRGLGAIPAGRVALSRVKPDLAALDAQDAAAAEIAEGAAVGMVEQQLLGDAAGVVDLDNVERLSDVKGGPQWRCLAKALYFEARGQPPAGQIAVGEVILNRVESRSYPDSVCAVVDQGAEQRNACQFSFMCDGRPERITEKAAFARAGKLAHLLMEGRPRTLTRGATHFHATAVRPRWARKLDRTARIGDHVFYRDPTVIAAN